MMLAFALFAAQASPAPPDAIDIYVSCNLERARTLISAGYEDEVVRDRPYEECYHLRGAAVRQIQAGSKIGLSSGALGMAAAGLDGAIERRVADLLSRRAASPGPMSEGRN